MANVKGLLADPKFADLDLATQKSVLAGIDPQFSHLSDDEFNTFKSTLMPVDMRPRNVGKDTSGEGFLAHATKTLRDLPDAFLSGRMVSGPIQALGQSMQNYLQNQSLHNSLRAIPGVGMAEDILAQPYRTAASGDTGGAFGDAVDISGQMVAPELARRAGAADLPDVTRPLVAAKGAAKGALKGSTEMVPITHGIVQRFLGVPEMKVPAVIAGGAQGAGAGELLGGKMGAITGGAAGAMVPIVRGAIKGGKQALKDLDFHEAFVNRPKTDYSGIGPSVLAPDMAQYGTPKPQPKEFSNPVSLPEGVNPAAQQMSPEQVQANLHAQKYPTLGLKPLRTDIPGGTLGKGPQAGFGPGPDLRPPVEVGGAHIPPYPPRSVWDLMAPGEMTPEEFAAHSQSEKYPGLNLQPLRTDIPGGTIGKQSFTPPPRVIEPINKVSLPEGVNPPVVAPKPVAIEPPARLPASGSIGRQSYDTPRPQPANFQNRSSQPITSITGLPEVKPAGLTPEEFANVRLPQMRKEAASVAETKANTAAAPVFSAPLTPTGVPMIPLTKAPVDLPEMMANRYSAVGAKHGDIRAMNTHNKTTDIAEHLHAAGVQNVDRLSDEAINKYIGEVNAKTGNEYKPIGHGSKGKGEGRSVEQMRSDLNLYLKHMRGELK